MKKIVLNLIFAKVGFYVSLSKDVLAQWTDWPRYKCNGRWDSRKPCASLVRFCWGDTKRTGDPNNGLYTWWYCNHKSSWNLEGGFDVWKKWKKEIFRNCLALQDNVIASILKKRWAGPPTAHAKVIDLTVIDLAATKYVDNFQSHLRFENWRS